MINTLKHYSINFSWMMLENLVKILVGFTISVYVIRYLGPKDFGLISYSLSIVGILTPFASLGLDAILFRNLINDSANEATLIYTAKVLKLLASIFLIIISIPILYFYTDQNDFFYIFTLLLIGLLIDVFALYNEYFLSIEKTKYITISSIISLVFSSILNITLVLLKSYVVWFAIVYLVQKIINIIGLKYYYKKKSSNKKSKFDFSLAKTMLQDSWPLIFTSFAGLLYMSTDQILIKYFLDFEQVGLYATAVKLIMVFYVIPSILSNILYPKLIQSYKSLARNDFLKKVQVLYFFNLLIAILILLFFILFGEDIILFLFGNEFLPSTEVLHIYSFGLIFVFFGSMNNKILMMENMQKLMLGRNILGLILNLILNLILIPEYGIVGGAISTVFSEFLIMLSYGLNSRIKYILVLQLKAFVYPFIVIMKNIK
jgi:O-antigen/teichoic acid export membrane protein